jgi:hypothetical protein
MGTTSAVVGAYILAGEIGRHCGGSNTEDTDRGDDTKERLTAALKAYEQKLRPFMDQVQKGVLEDSGWSGISSMAFGISIMSCLLGVASLLRVNIGKYFLKKDVKGWDLPEYVEMRLA